MFIVFFLKCGIIYSLDGIEGGMVYNVVEDINEFDDFFIRELF